MWLCSINKGLLGKGESDKWGAGREVNGGGLWEKGKGKGGVGSVREMRETHIHRISEQNISASTKSQN